MGVGIFCVVGIGPAVSAEPICTHVDMEWISQQAPLSQEVKIVYKKDRGKLCEVVLALDGKLWTH